MTVHEKPSQGIGVGAAVGLVIDCCWRGAKSLPLNRIVTLPAEGTAFVGSTPYNVGFLPGRVRAHSITTALENLTRQLSQRDTGDAVALRFDAPSLKTMRLMH